MIDPSKAQSSAVRLDLRTASAILADADLYLFSDGAGLVAQKLIRLFERPILVSDYELFVTASVGIAMTAPGVSADTLLKNADMALYRAKADGRGTYRFFETGMDARAQARRLLERDLRLALEARDQLDDISGHIDARGYDPAALGLGPQAVADRLTGEIDDGVDH